MARIVEVLSQFPPLLSGKIFAIPRQAGPYAVRDRLQSYLGPAALVELFDKEKDGYNIVWIEEEEWDFSPHLWWVENLASPIRLKGRRILSLSDSVEPDHLIACIFSSEPVVSQSLHEEISDVLQEQGWKSARVELSLEKGIGELDVFQIDVEPSQGSPLSAYQWRFAALEPKERYDQFQRLYRSVPLAEGVVMCCHAMVDEIHVALTREGDLLVLSTSVKQPDLPSLVTMLYSKFQGFVLHG